MGPSEHYRQLYEHAVDATLTVKRDGRIADCNPAAVRLLQQARATLLGTRFLGWIARAQRDAATTALARAFAGEVTDCPLTVERDGGAQRPVSMRAIPFLRRSAVEAILIGLRETEVSDERLAAVQLAQFLQALPDQFVLIIGDDARIRYVRGVCGTHGLDEAECVGQDIAVLLDSGDETTQAVEALRRETRLGHAWRGAIWQRHADGTRFLSQLSAAPFRDPRGQQLAGAMVTGRRTSESEQVLREKTPDAAVKPTRGILVVDDDQAIRTALRKCLERAGYEVREGWSGRNALAQITDGKQPDLILTDLKMDHGSGFWLVGQMSRHFPHLLARTVIMTGAATVPVVERLVAETGCDVLRKPFEYGVLLEVLERVSAGPASTRESRLR